MLRLSTRHVEAALKVTSCVISSEKGEYMQKQLPSFKLSRYIQDC